MNSVRRRKSLLSLIFSTQAGNITPKFSKPIFLFYLKNLFYNEVYFFIPGVFFRFCFFIHLVARRGGNSSRQFLTFLCDLFSFLTPRYLKVSNQKCQPCVPIFRLDDYKNPDGNFFVVFLIAKCFFRFQVLF